MSQLVFHVDQLQRAAEHQVGQRSTEEARTEQLQRIAERQALEAIMPEGRLHPNLPLYAFGT